VRGRADGGRYGRGEARGEAMRRAHVRVKELGRTDIHAQLRVDERGKADIRAQVRVEDAQARANRHGEDAAGALFCVMDAHMRENDAQARVSGVSAALLGVASVDLCYNIRVPAERK